MNERDISLVEDLMNEIESLKDDGSNLLVLDTSFTQIAKTNLLLLKGLLDMEQRGGYFVVLDRPHQYMAYLLHMHDVSQDRLWFIDTVTHMSGQKKVDKENVDFVEGPFHIENVFEALQSKESQGSDYFKSMEEIDFIVIDNISSMLNYNSLEKIDDFIGSLDEVLKPVPNTLGCITLDSESNPDLYDLVLDHSESVIDIDDLKSR